MTNSKQTWEEEFNRKFLNHTNEFINPWKFEKSKHIPEVRDLEKIASDLKDFISQELTKAREEERERKIEEDYGFWDLVSIARTILNTKYPADVFDWSSGDMGPVFVTKLREAIQLLSSNQKK